MSIADQLDRLVGSPTAKARLRVILANLAGQVNVADACADLGIEESWFFDLKHESLQRWLKALEPGSPGRPPSAEKTTEQQQIANLEAKVERLELELKAARLRAELARAGLSRSTSQRKYAVKKANR
jgi:transposase-like protein